MVFAERLNDWMAVHRCMHTPRKCGRMWTCNSGEVYATYVRDILPFAGLAPDCSDSLFNYEHNCFAASLKSYIPQTMHKYIRFLCGCVQVGDLAESPLCDQFTCCVFPFNITQRILYSTGVWHGAGALSENHHPRIVWDRLCVHDWRSLLVWACVWYSSEMYRHKLFMMFTFVGIEFNYAKLWIYTICPICIID